MYHTIVMILLLIKQYYLEKMGSVQSSCVLQTLQLGENKLERLAKQKSHRLELEKKRARLLRQSVSEL
jgi:hypothetical protein